MRSMVRNFVLFYICISLIGLFIVAANLLPGLIVTITTIISSIGYMVLLKRRRQQK